MSKHPNKADDEVFIGNVETEKGVPGCMKRLKTIRLSEGALDINGEELGDTYRALFVNKNEAAKYGRIMEEKLSAIKNGYK